MLISVVIPVYNAENTIEKLVKMLIEKIGAEYNMEIILVNDCSRDMSEECCISLHKEFPRIVRFFSLSKNAGEHNAVMAGLNQTRGDYTVIMDDDFQNPVSEVLKLIRYALDSDYDVVYTYYPKKYQSIFRNIGSYFNDKVSNIMLKKPKNLYLSSFKIMNSFIVGEVIKYKLPYPYIDGLILRSTCHIGSIEVEHAERQSGTSNYTMKKLVDLWLNMFTNFSVVPLRISAFIGVILSLFGIGLGIVTIIEKVLNPQLPLGYAAILVSISVFSGIQLLAIGLIGEYLGRMFISQSRRPQFVVRKAFDQIKEDTEQGKP